MGDYDDRVHGNVYHCVVVNYMKTITACITLLGLSIPAAAQLPSSTISIGWDAVPTATGYRITLDGVSTDVGLPPMNTACQCVSVLLSVIPAQAHTFTVAAYTPGVVSGESVPLTLPSSCGASRPLSECWSIGAVNVVWTSVDIGFVNPAGKAAHGPGGTVTMQAGGLALGGTLDGFQFVSAASTTNGSLTARVASLTTGKAGIEWREDTTAQARHVAVTLTPAGAVDLLLRVNRGGTTRIVATKAAGTLPVYVRLTRGAGNTFAGSFSSDGTSWTPVGSVVQPLPSAMRLGLVALGVSSTVATTVQYDNIVKNP